MDSPVCILADGLYSYKGAFRACEDKGWKYIFVLQENSLKSVQEELVLSRRRKPVVEYYHVKEGWRISEEYRYQRDILYHEKYNLHRIECNEIRKKDLKKEKENKIEPQTGHFEYLTNI
jgi:hypothetical protein